MQYIYEDEFLTKDIDEDKLTRLEDTAIKEIDKHNIRDLFYFEKLVILKVYLELSKMNYEAVGMDKKYTILLTEYNTLLKELKDAIALTTDTSATTSSAGRVKSVKLFRG